MYPMLAVTSPAEFFHWEPQKEPTGVSNTPARPNSRMLICLQLSTVNLSDQLGLPICLSLQIFS
jgi:hypothetical protein